MSVETTTNQPNVIVVPPNGGGGGFFGRLVGAIIASFFLSGIGYVATYTTVFARFWLKKEGATVEMPAEKKAKAGIVKSAHSALDGVLGKLKETLAKSKETATGGIEKAKEAGATFGKKLEHKVDKKAEELKQLLAKRHEEHKKREEEAAKQLAIDKAKYEEWAARFREFYDATCTNRRCRAPLNLKIYPPTKIMHCVRCRTSFKVYQARALGRPQPPPFRPGNHSLFGGLFK